MNMNFGGLLQMGIYCFLLLGLLAAGLLFCRNGFQGFAQKNKMPRKLEISETRMLGGRQFLLVAQYEGRKMLIGVCPGRIDYLCNLGEAEDEAPFSSMLPEKPE